MNINGIVNTISEPYYTSPFYKDTNTTNNSGGNASSGQQNVEVNTMNINNGASFTGEENDGGNNVELATSGTMSGPLVKGGLNLGKNAYMHLINNNNTNYSNEHTPTNGD